MEEEEEDKAIKFCIVGDQFVGKTRFLRRFCLNELSTNYLGTLAFDIIKQSIQLGEQKYVLSLNDLSGQERFKKDIMSKIKISTKIIFMYDVTKQESFDSIPEWIETVKENNKNDGLQMILIGNKIDLENERKISKEQGREFAEKNAMDFFEVSTKTGENVNEAMLFIIKKALGKPNDFSGEIIMDEKNINQKKNNNQKKKGCCNCL